MELKACPFCGGVPRVSKRYVGYGSIGLGSHDLFSIECTECRAKSSEHKSEEQAVNVWNQRASIPQDKLVTEMNGLIADVNVAEIASHVQHGTLLGWTETWRMKAYMIAGFLNEMLIKFRKDEGK